MFLYEVRPAAHGSYNVRYAINTNKPIAKKTIRNTKKDVNVLS
jgi:hypothetical protein